MYGIRFHCNCICGQQTDSRQFFSLVYCFSEAERGDRFITVRPHAENKVGMKAVDVLYYQWQYLEAKTHPLKSTTSPRHSPCEANPLMAFYRTRVVESWRQQPRQLNFSDHTIGLDVIRPTELLVYTICDLEKRLKGEEFHESFGRKFLTNCVWLLEWTVWF